MSTNDLGLRRAKQNVDGGEPVRHGIAHAFYNNLPGPHPRPALECLCGELFQRASWEDAGAELDDHLKGQL